MRTKVFIVFLVFIFCIVNILICLFQKQTKKENSSYYYWIPEESYFVDYEIIDKNTVKFRYSICFVNSYTEDITISLFAKFKKSETKGWLKNDFLNGCDENQKLLKATLKQGEKKNITFVFTGEYLGGKVNTNLSFPDRMLLVG